MSRYADAVMALNPVAYWRLGEPVGSLALDETFAYQGTYIGTKVLGEPGALSDDADTAVTFLSNPVGYIDVSPPLAVDATNAFTYSCFFKSSFVLDAQTLFSRGTGTCRLLVTATGDFSIVKENVQELRHTSGIVLNDDEWHHLIYIRLGATEHNVYIDGEAMALTYVSDADYVDSGAHLLLAVYTNVGQFWLGSLDEIAVFDYSLTSDEAATLIAATAPAVTPLKSMAEGIYGALDVSGVTSLAVGGIHRSKAPHDTAFPFVVFTSEPTPSVPNVLTGEAYIDVEWDVKVVDKGESAEAADLAYAQVHAALQNAALTIPGYRPMYVRREGLIGYTEDGEGGVTYQHVGGRYRIMAQAT